MIPNQADLSPEEALKQSQAKMALLKSVYARKSARRQLLLGLGLLIGCLVVLLLVLFNITDLQSPRTTIDAEVVKSDTYPCGSALRRTCYELTLEYETNGETLTEVAFTDRMTYEITQRTGLLTITYVNDRPYSFEIGVLDTSVSLTPIFIIGVFALLATLAALWFSWTRFSKWRALGS
jgi:hypothetical protein